METSWLENVPMGMRADPFWTALIHAAPPPEKMKRLKSGPVVIAVTDGRAQVYIGRTIGRGKSLEWQADCRLFRAVLAEPRCHALRSGIWVVTTYEDKVTRMWNYRYTDRTRFYQNVDEAVAEACGFDSTDDQHFHIFHDGNYVKSITNPKVNVLHAFNDGVYVETRPVGGVAVKWADTPDRNPLDFVRPDGFGDGVWVVTELNGEVAASNLGRDGPVKTVEEAVAEINRVGGDAVYHVFEGGRFLLSQQGSQAAFRFKEFYRDDGSLVFEVRNGPRVEGMLWHRVHDGKVMIEFLPGPLGSPAVVLDELPTNTAMDFKKRVRYVKAAVGKLAGLPQPFTFSGMATENVTFKSSSGEELTVERRDKDVFVSLSRGDRLYTNTLCNQEKVSVADLSAIVREFMFCNDVQAVKRENPCDFLHLGRHLFVDMQMMVWYRNTAKKWTALGTLTGRPGCKDVSLRLINKYGMSVVAPKAFDELTSLELMTLARVLVYNTDTARIDPGSNVVWTPVFIHDTL